MKFVNIIFLDIDGVLNRLGGIEEGRTTTRWHGYIGMEPELVQRFNELVKNIKNVGVVLSSTWRLDDDWRETMKKNGIECEFLGRTPSLNNSGRSSVGRGLEIQSWLQSQSVKSDFFVEKFCILDDDSDFLPDQKHFHTSFISGLTEEIAKEVEEYFKE